MEGIQRVVSDIVQECRTKDVECSETLAAFMVSTACDSAGALTDVIPMYQARAVILDRPERFTPDKPLNDEDIKALIDICGATRTQPRGCSASLLSYG